MSVVAAGGMGVVDFEYTVLDIPVYSEGTVAYRPEEEVCVEDDDADCEPYRV